MHMMVESDIHVMTFINEGGVWFADLPHFLEEGLGTRDDLIMVDGADTFLDLLSEGRPVITLKLSANIFPGYVFLMSKVRMELGRELPDQVGLASIDYGAYYQVTSLQENVNKHQLWLCPVTVFVFGSYPLHIYAAVV